MYKIIKAIIEFQICSEMELFTYEYCSSKQ